MRPKQLAVVFGVMLATVTGISIASEPVYTIIHHPNPDPPKGAYLGHSVVALDWNADGAVDIAAGAPGENRTYVFLGPAFEDHEVVTVDGLDEDARFGNSSHRR